MDSPLFVQKFWADPVLQQVIIAKCVIADKQVKQVSFLPTYINKRSQPEVLIPDDRRFAEVTGYIAEISKDQGLETNFTVQGDEVIIVNDQEAKEKLIPKEIE